MKFIVPLFLLAFFFITSCSDPNELKQNELKIMLEINRDMRKNNASLLSKIEAIVKEKGERTLDVKLLNSIRATLLLRNSFDLDYSIEDWGNLKSPPLIEDKNLLAFISAFTESFAKLKSGENSYDKTEELAQRARLYLEEKSLFHFLLLDLQVINLEKDLIGLGTASIGIGNTDAFGFDGQVYAYPQNQETRSKEPRKTLITLGHDIIGASITLSEPEILINGEKNLPYQLESFNKGLWLLTFTPEAPGTYVIDFITHFTSDIYPSEQYAFTGQFEVNVR